MITYDLKSHYSDKVYTFKPYSKMIDSNLCFFADDGMASIRTVSLHDRSVIEPFKYDSKCATCFHHWPHSKEYHDLNLIK